MYFEQASFLWALGLIAIPIIIHLFNFRRYKLVPFSNVRMLHQVEEQSKAAKTLRQWLVLLARCLTIIFLVLAFARPHWGTTLPDNRADAGQVISLFVDNSPSMAAQGEQGELLNLAKEKARELIREQSPETKIQLLTQDFEGRHQRLYSREEAIALLDEVNITNAAHPLDEVIERVKSLHARYQVPNKELFVFSDFQEGFLQENNTAYDTTLKQYWILTPAQGTDNVSVDSAWLNTPCLMPGRMAALTVVLKNHGDKLAEEVPLAFSFNGQDKSRQAVNIPAGDTVQIQLTFIPDQSGNIPGRLSITDQPITFDNQLYLNLDISKGRNILLVQPASESGRTAKVFSNDVFFQMSQMDPVQPDFSKLNTAQLVVMEGVNNPGTGMAEALKKYVEQGGVLWINPAFKGYPDMDWASFLAVFGIKMIAENAVQQAPGAINWEHPLFSGIQVKDQERVNLPQIKRMMVLNPESGFWQPLIKTQTGQGLLWEGKLGKGAVYLLASNPENNWTTYPDHALWVVNLLNAALFQPGSAPLYYKSGEENAIPVPPQSGNNEKLFKLSGEGKVYAASLGYVQMSPRIFTEAGTIDPGYYRILRNTEEAIGAAAFNNSRAESVQAFETAASLEEKAAAVHAVFLKAGERNMAALVKDSRQGLKLWKICILLALAFIGFEILLLRFIR